MALWATLNAPGRFDAVSATMHALGAAGSSGRGPARRESNGAVPHEWGRTSPADLRSAGHPARAEIRVVSPASPGGKTGAGGGDRRDVSKKGRTGVCDY